jgi:hypothetical protein
MKINQLKKYVSLGAAALALGSAGTAFAQTADLPIQTFDADANGTGHEWGSGTQSFDASTGNAAGALLVTVDFSSSSDTPCTTYICYKGGNPWYTPATIQFSQYKAIEFDIKWDNTSDITIDQFNNLGTWNTTMTNQAGQPIMLSWAGSGYLAGSTGGLDIDLCGGPGGQMSPFIINTNIPAAAANGWAHVVIPINAATAGIDGCNGIVFHKWINQQWGIQNDAQGRFWIDNVILQGTAGPPPPPKLSPLVKAAQGLNVFASTAGLYDRQSAVLRQNSGLSWVGQATPANPVTYSFTIAGYPSSVNCEAWMFLVPNPAYLDGAPDWNETNCAIVYLQGNSKSATAHFQYKVNENSQQAMYSAGNETRTTATTTNNYYYSMPPGSLPGGPITTVLSPGVYNITNESGNLASVTNNGVLGTWTVKFTSDTNATLIAPDGNSTNFIVPAYNVGLFAEQTSPGFYIYLGMQANNADAINQAVVYSNFAVSNTASPFYEDFTADSVLDTTNIWNTGAAAGPIGVLVAPVGSASWVSWTLPDAGFSLQAAPTLNNPLGWTVPSTGPILGLSGIRSQLVASNEIPAGKSAFFQLIKRSFTQLQVLLPGETNAPNTLTGKVGSPTPISAGSEVDVTVNAVDKTFHLVSSTDTISLATTDTGAAVPSPAALVNGTVTMQLYLNDTGSWTVTATNTTSTNIPAATSSPITVQ